MCRLIKLNSDSEDKFSIKLYKVKHNCPGIRPGEMHHRVFTFNWFIATGGPRIKQRVTMLTIEIKYLTNPTFKQCFSANLMCN